MADNNTSRVILGSGNLYIAELTNNAIPETLFNDTNKVGCISGGAELSYTPTVYDVVCDEGVTRASFITEEEVLLKSGILSWILANMEKISVGCRYDASTKTLYVGGQNSVKQYAIGFKHTAKDGYSVEASMIGRGNKGFTISFAKDKETVVDVEFKAVKDSKGILVKIVEKEATTNTETA